MIRAQNIKTDWDEYVYRFLQAASTETDDLPDPTETAGQTAARSM